MDSDFSPMTCPHCGGGTRVIETRYTQTENAVRRRRECDECSKRISTMERWVDVEPKLSGAQKRGRIYIEVDLRGQRPTAIVR